MYETKKILVTGGAGFVGSNLVNKLIDIGAHVIVVDDLSNGSLRNINGNKEIDYKFYELSVTDIAIRDIVSRVDIIFHLAARNIIASTKNPTEDYITNIGGTLNVLMSAKESDIEKVVYTSSASVYGNPKYLPINEDDGINLLTPYAVSKYAGEGYCSAFNESYGTPVTILRLSNVYGPRQNIGVVPSFMRLAKKGENLTVCGDGLSTRDYTYIDDVINALLLAGMSPKSDGEVFNVATGIETSVNELANSIAILHILDHMEDDEFDIDIVNVEDRDIDNIRRRVLNIEKIRRKLGWMPKYTLERGVKETKDWMDNDSQIS